jgi:hypothetical protein
MWSSSIGRTRWKVRLDENLDGCQLRGLESLGTQERSFSCEPEGDNLTLFEMQEKMV